jgi:aminoglycoside 6'-N-acetyltransferase
MSVERRSARAPQSAVSLRLASAADVATLETWDHEAGVVDAGGQDDDFDWRGEVSRDVDWREILIAEVEGRPIGALVIIDPAREESHYWGDCAADLRAIDIWIGEASMRGKGHGSSTMRQALARCFAEAHVRAVLIDPLARNSRAIRFYERLGFRRVGPRRFGDDECLVLRLDRATWQTASSSDDGT